MNNQELRNYSKKKNVYLWEIAKKLNISEPTMTRMLRNELSKCEKRKMIELVDEIAILKEGEKQ